MQPKRLAMLALLAALSAGWLQSARSQTDPLPLPVPDSPKTLLGPYKPYVEELRPLSLASQPTSGPPGAPINLATALQLAGAKPLDIAAAIAQVDEAMGLLTQAKALKIPNINGGIGYYRHDGTNQNLFTGATFRKSTNAVQLGGGPTINLGVTDAIFAPLAARQIVGSREADLQAARNNVLNSVAQAYFTLQDAKGRLIGAEAAITRTERLVRFAEGLAPNLIAPLEINRSKAQLENLRQYRETVVRDWRVASAQLAEILLLDPGTILDPIEPPFLQFGLIPPESCADDMVPLALSNRPEIASQRLLLVAANEQLRREKSRPFLPNIVMSTPGTANAGVLAAGQFYGGANGNNLTQGSRDDFSVAAYWQLTNGGFGNLGLIKQRKAERNLAEIDVTRVLFRVRTEVSQALARLQTSNARVPRAEEELRQAIESADKNFVGLSETTRPAGELLNLVVRPQEVVAALQELNTAFQNYSGAVNEFNRAQFELYRSLGQPAQWVTSLRTPVEPITVRPLASWVAPATSPPPPIAPPAGNLPPLAR